MNSEYSFDHVHKVVDGRVQLVFGDNVRFNIKIGKPPLGRWRLSKKDMREIGNLATAAQSLTKNPQPITRYKDE